MSSQDLASITGMLIKEVNLTYKKVYVTPAIAAHWLLNNHPHNRIKKTSKIMAYAEDMKTGNWKEDTGEFIKFNNDGVLIDGQNRLYAVIESQVDGIWLEVAFDTSTDVMLVLDSGAARTAGDVMQIAGAPNRFNASSVVRWIIGWEKKVYTGKGGSLSPTHTQLMMRYKQDADLFDTATFRGRDCNRHGLGTAAAMGTAFYLFSKINHEQAHAFFDTYLSGLNLTSEDNPISRLRNRIGNRNDRSTRAEQLAMTIRSWNYYRRDEPMKVLFAVNNSGKLTNDNFPMPN